MALDEIPRARPAVDVVRADWAEHRRVGELPPGLLAAGAHDRFHILVARLAGENVATGLAFDVDGDCGIYNVGTLAHARRRGLTRLNRSKQHRLRGQSVGVRRGPRRVSSSRGPSAVAH